MLPLCRDVDLCQGKEGSTGPVCGRILEAQNNKMHPEGLNSHQEASETSGIVLGYESSIFYPYLRANLSRQTSRF
jgi:hypothetical protein